MYDEGIVSRPVNQYDVQRAVGCGSDDIGTLCKYVNINPMAKYKPIRYNSVQAITDAIRSSSRYGFASITPPFSTSSPNNKAVWEYLKPRGGDYSEPYRLTDFVDDDRDGVGYDAYACAPFAFGVEGAKLDSDTVNGNGGVGLPLYVNSAVNAYYASTGYMWRWREDAALSISELLNWYSGDAYIGFAIFDLDDTTKTTVLITNKKLRDVSSSVETVILTSVERTISGKTSPAVTIFQDARRDGHKFRFIAFLYNNFGGGNVNTHNYVILTQDGVGYNVNSLAFVDGIDRHDVVVWLRNTIRGLECSLVNSGLTLAYISTETINGYQFRKYQCYGTVYGNFKTPVDWANNSVRVKVTISTMYGYPTSVTAPANYEKEVNVSLPSYSTTYNNQVLATLPQNPSNANEKFFVYFISNVDLTARYVLVSAVAYGSAGTEAERVFFEDPYEVHATQ